MPILGPKYRTVLLWSTPLGGGGGGGRGGGGRGGGAGAPAPRTGTRPGLSQLTRRRA